MIKPITTRSELTSALNGHLPVVIVDVNHRDEYGGFIGSNVRIINSYGSVSYATFRVFPDTGATFFEKPFGIVANLTNVDVNEIADYANAPTIHPDSEYVVVIKGRDRTGVLLCKSGINNAFTRGTYVVREDKKAIRDILLKEVARVAC